MFRVFIDKCVIATFVGHGDLHDWKLARRHEAEAHDRHYPRFPNATCFLQVPITTHPSMVWARKLAWDKN